MRIALLTDLVDTVEPNALASEAALAFEIADALAQSARDAGGFTLDLFARRGSWHGVPLVSVDLDELPRSSSKELDLFARQEAAYCQLILAGMLRDYQLVHCLAPVVTPLQLLSSMRVPIVQTVLVAGHPSGNLPRVILRRGVFEQTSLVAAGCANGARVIVPSVDLERFQLHQPEPDGFILWMGTAGRKGHRAASTISGLLGIPLRTPTSGEPTELLCGARLLLHLTSKSSPAGSVWPLRALACGIPVAGWSGADLDALCNRSEIGALAPQGDCDLLVERIREVLAFPDAPQLRREMVLARHNRRAMTARYREVYSSILERG
jgi:hypothetical protein